MAKRQEITLKLIETSDVHGAYFPYDFINDRPSRGSLARVYAYVTEQREKFGNRLILLDNGDILQGQPTAYYYNYIDTTSPHMAASALNAMHYDAVCIGNHDVETGHAVYDRWAAECKCPVLGANVIDTRTGEPYFKPYVMIEREGVRVAVLGLTSPAIPYWLPPNLWSGLQFEDMETSARKWMKIIQDKENPHVVVGLFHSGKDAGIRTDTYRENAILDIAHNVPGFDIIFFGHDHRRDCEMVTDDSTKARVLCVNPSSQAWCAGDVEMKIVLDGDNIVSKNLHGKLANVNRFKRTSNAVVEFEKMFHKQFHAVNEFVSRRIGRMESPIHCRDAYFGPSAFIDLIHTLQLQISGADISFAAPLSYDAHIEKGDVYVRDMFNLYKFENMLYTMRLTGQEIKDFMEMSYTLWTNQMQCADDHILLLSLNHDGGKRLGITNYAYNFDSAAGIRYTVDVTKPQGEKISIESMADGTPFDLQKNYLVALNSYRGNGGGELLTKGAGIAQTELHKRIVKSTDVDLRYYLMRAIEKAGSLNPQPLNQWRFVPDEWTVPACQRDRKLLFPSES